MKIAAKSFLYFLFLMQITSAQTNDSLDVIEAELKEVDRIRIAEAFRLSDSISNDLWPLWQETPLALLFVTEKYEFLIRHPRPSDDFTLLKYDPLLKSDIYYRPTVFQTHLLATFPAVGGLSTIVIGRAENTASNTSTKWVTTLLHEHFHQIQNSLSDYYTSVDGLGLSRGDNTGMWMLNFPFPYDSVVVEQSIANLSKKLAELLLAIDNENFNLKVADYLTLRKEFTNTLAEDDYKYFSFQVWQEGIARFAELEATQWVAINYQPTPDFKQLPDYEPFQNVAENTYQNIINQLEEIKLKELRRIVFYYIGAAEGIILNKINPSWKTEYFENKFYVENYFNQ